MLDLDCAPKALVEKAGSQPRVVLTGCGRNLPDLDPNGKFSDHLWVMLGGRAIETIDSSFYHSSCEKKSSALSCNPHQNVPLQNKTHSSSAGRS